MLDVLICVLQRMMKITERLRMNSKQLFSFFFFPGLPLWYCAVQHRSPYSLLFVLIFVEHACRAVALVSPLFFFFFIISSFASFLSTHFLPPPPFSVSHNRAFLRKGRGESIVTAASKKMRIKMLWLFPYACLFFSQLGKRKSRRER